MVTTPNVVLSILIVDDQSATRAALAAELDRSGYRVLEADSADWALELFKRHRPDLVLMDVEMPGRDGYWTAREIRAADPGGWTPIIFLSNLRSAEDVRRGIDAGGDDYLPKPVPSTILHAKLYAMQRLSQMRQRLVQVSQELREANAQLQRLSGTDSLTGLLNRRALDERLRDELQRAHREQLPLTVMLCDVDHFKRYNDSAGHVQGDLVLSQLAVVLRGACRRPADCAGRYGGEEFALILPNTPRSGAMTYARALMRLLASAGLVHPDSPVSAQLTLSGGISTCLPDEKTAPEGLWLRADEALYNAKALGRNRFFSYEMQMGTSG